MYGVCSRHDHRGVNDRGFILGTLVVGRSSASTRLDGVPTTSFSNPALSIEKKHSRH